MENVIGGHGMKGRKVLACVMAMVLVLSSLTVTPRKVQAAESKVAISSIRYEFEVSGLTTEKSLKFCWTTADSWENGGKEVLVEGDGNYSVTVPLSKGAGMRNMGYFETISGSQAQVKVSKIVINDKYELGYVRTVKIGSSSQNGLHNIWDGTTAGEKIAEGKDSYLAMNSDKSAFEFYVVEDAGEGGSEEVSPSNPLVVATITEEDLKAAQVDGWQSASKATLYVKITEGDSDSLINAAIKLGPTGEDGEPIGKSSSKYLVGRTNTDGKTGNAIQDQLVGEAGTGIYKFPDINLNKSCQDSSKTWLAEYANKITLVIKAMSPNTKCEVVGITFNNGKVYPLNFTEPKCEAITYDEVKSDEKANLKLTLDYCGKMKESNYQKASWDLFVKAIEKAQKVYDGPTVSQAKYQSARAELEKVKANLLFNNVTDSGNPLPFRELTKDEVIYEMGAGINLGNTMDGHSGFTPNETVWQSVVTTKAYIKALHDAGYNTVRIPVTWGTMIEEDNGYAINSAWISRVQDIVDYCVSLDMYAIINIHHDGAEQTGWLRVAADDIDKVYEQFEHVWRNIAEYFKDYDEHLIFESMNEITCMEGDLKNSQEAIEKDTPVIVNLNQIFVNVVRSTGSNNTKRWLAVVSHYANVGTQQGFVLPQDSYNESNKLMFAAHIYKASTNVKWTYQEVYQVVDGLKKMADKHKVPLILGEYGNRNYVQAGTETGYNDVARAYFCEIVHKACQVAGVVPVVWDQGGDKISDTGIFYYWNRKEGKPVFKAITDAMMRGTYLPATSKNKSYDFKDIEEGVTVKEITSIQLSKEKVSMALGSNETIVATVAPGDTNDVVLWSSEDESIVTVTRGILRARGIGVTTVKAYSQSGSVVATLQVTVKANPSEVAATDITMKDLEVQVVKGKYTYLQPTLVPAGSKDGLTYRSTNEEVATVNALGKIVGVNFGTAYVVVTASSGVTKVVKVHVTKAGSTDSIDLALNVLYNDSSKKYWGVELGDAITVTGDGQYSVTFDLSKHLSKAGKNAGIDQIANLTAIYIKDYNVAVGNEGSSPLLSADIRYDKITVNGKELTITNSDFRTALRSQNIFDTGGPINAWDGSSVKEVSVKDHVANITGITKPTTMTVTFTLKNVVFTAPDQEKEAPATGMDAVEKKVVINEIGETGQVKVNVQPLTTDSLVSFVSSNEAVVYVDSMARFVEGDGSVTATLTAMGLGKATITATTENGFTVTFTVVVGEDTEEVPGEDTKPGEGPGEDTEKPDEDTTVDDGQGSGDSDGDKEDAGQGEVEKPEEELPKTGVMKDYPDNTLQYSLMIGSMMVCLYGYYHLSEQKKKGFYKK